MHRLTYLFQADGADITKRVHEFRFFYGLRGFSSHTAPLLSRARARLILANDDSYWTDARLDALSRLTMDCDGIRMATLNLGRWERLRRRRVLVNCTSILDYEKSASFHAYQDDLDEGELLTAVGLTITPATSWEGWTVDNGALWTGNAFNFLRLFGTHANAMVCENGNGSVRAFVPQSDTRTGAFTIDFAGYNVLTDTLNSAHVDTWQRNAQNYMGLDYTEHLKGEVDFGHQFAWTGTSNNPLYKKALISGGMIRFEFDMESVADSSNKPSNWNSLICRPLFWSSGNPGTHPIFRANGNTVVWDGRFEEAPSTDERCAVYLSRADGVALTQSDLDNLEIYGITRIAAYWTYDDDFTRTQKSIRLTDTSDDYLPDMPWDAGSNAVSMFESKLNWWNTSTPKMTRLEFHEVQHSSAAWESLLNMPLAGVAELNLFDGDFLVQEHGHPIAHSWQYQAQGLSTLTIDFLSYRQLGTRGIAFESADQPIYFETEDQPIERDRA